MLLENWSLMRDKDMIPSILSGLCGRWGFLVLAPASCDTAYGWHRRHGLWRLMMDSKTWWHLSGTMTQEEIREILGSEQYGIVLFDFPALMGVTEERKYSWMSPMAEQCHTALWYSGITKPAAKRSAEQCGAAAPTAWKINVNRSSQGVCDTVSFKCICLLLYVNQPHFVWNDLKCDTLYICGPRNITLITFISLFAKTPPLPLASMQ